jgi:hypothetical protein
MQTGKDATEDFPHRRRCGVLKAPHMMLTLFQRLAVLDKEEHVEHKVKTCTQTDMGKRP